MSIDMHVFPSESWFHARFGLDFSEDILMDPVRRTEMTREAERNLYEVFRDVGMGNPDPKPTPIAGNMFGHRFIPALFGSEIHYQKDQAPSALHAEADYDKMSKLEIPDFETSEVIRLYFEQAEALIKKYGFCNAEINFGSPLNVAVNLYGDKFLMSCLEEPETAQHVLRVITDTQFLLYDKLQHVLEPKVYPKSPINMGYGNCHAIMISPETYREVVLPVDKYFRSRIHEFSIHHCGVFDKYIDIYKELTPQHLDIGGGSDYKEICRNFPDQKLSLIVNTNDAESRNASEIRSFVKQIVEDAGDSRDRIQFLWCSDISPQMSDDNIRALKTSTQNL